MQATATLTLAVGATIALAPTASADRVDRRSLCDVAREVRHDVVKEHGKRAPGRAICDDGVTAKRPLPRSTCQYRGHVRRGRARQPTNHEKACYVRALKRLRNPPPLLTRAGPPPVDPAGTASPRAGSTLQAIAQCESGGNPAMNTGNGFYGKYQFTQSTWASVGGSGSPSVASEAEQDRRAAMLYAREGSSPWPVCGR